MSLATALLPKLADHATDGNLTLVGSRLTSAMRMCLAVMVPVAALITALAIPIAALIFDYGAASGDTRAVALTLAALMPGLVTFTVHYLAMRGFYALQDTRTPFFIQVWIALAMVINALIVSRAAPAELTTILLAAGFSAAHVIGASISLTVLHRRIGRVATWSIVGHILHVLVPAAVAAGAAYGVVRALSGPTGDLPGWLGNLVVLATAGTIGLTLFVAAAFAVRVSEVREAIGLIARRVAPLRRESGPSMESQGRDAHGDNTGGESPH